MITRIVKMTFNPGFEEKFLKIFEESSEKIRSFDGCQGLILYRDRHQPNVFFTYSLWDSTESLDAYRDSLLFKTTWAATKVLFADKPQAWSLDGVKALL